MEEVKRGIRRSEDKRKGIGKKWIVRRGTREKANDEQRCGRERKRREWGTG